MCKRGRQVKSGSTLELQAGCRVAAVGCVSAQPPHRDGRMLSERCEAEG